jgi:hypothetical protein
MLRASCRVIWLFERTWVQDLNVVLRGQSLGEELWPLFYPLPIHLHEVQNASAFSCAYGCVSGLYLRQDFSHPAGIPVWENHIAGLALSG